MYLYQLSLPALTWLRHMFCKSLSKALPESICIKWVYRHWHVILGIMNMFSKDIFECICISWVYLHWLAILWIRHMLCNSLSKALPEYICISWVYLYWHVMLGIILKIYLSVSVSAECTCIDVPFYDKAYVL